MDDSTAIKDASSRISREQVSKFENYLLTHPQLEIKTTHHFCDGIYMREIFIPKDTILTGKIHKTEHFNIVSTGTIRVTTDAGVETISAPHTFKSSPGTKRLGATLEDTVWTTIHPNIDNIEDIPEIEDRLVESSIELEKAIKKCLL